ncbi:uncharacterized protein EV420DRAFT_515524 [Desarmillaria tabescens]|uniref:Secreted protein n=1 Tax=Armillaria tabescens TaxID=1929756 RepID=A0AA39KA14_ARMTA|nr:uncharacterized protein EV420DRAFT_515524 [Desarmillaria tabescens]KAK0457255.1 hypothetical protein EV420DRAFT_515524 [Desarmillaria tabescens]
MFSTCFIIWSRMVAWRWGRPCPVIAQRQKVVEMARKVSALNLSNFMPYTRLRPLRGVLRVTNSDHHHHALHVQRLAGSLWKSGAYPSLRMEIGSEAVLLPAPRSSVGGKTGTRQNCSLFKDN